MLVSDSGCREGRLRLQPARSGQARWAGRSRAVGEPAGQRDVGGSDAGAIGKLPDTRDGGSGASPRVVPGGPARLEAGLLPSLHDDAFQSGAGNRRVPAPDRQRRGPPGAPRVRLHGRGYRCHRPAGRLPASRSRRPTGPRSSSATSSWTTCTASRCCAPCARTPSWRRRRGHDLGQVVQGGHRPRARDGRRRLRGEALRPRRARGSRGAPARPTGPLPGSP